VVVEVLCVLGGFVFLWQAKAEGSCFDAIPRRCNAEKARLVEERYQAIWAYSQAAKALSGKLNTTTLAEYERLRDAVIVAQDKSKEADIALERHQAKHSC
jgi:hypothetical protein